MATSADTLAALLNGASAGNSGFYDLNDFEKSLQSSNYLSQAAAPVLSARFDTSTWSPQTSFGVSAAQSFLGAALNALGQKQVDDQLARTVAILPALYENPTAVAAPEGVPVQAFKGLQASAIREQALEKAKEDRTLKEMRLKIAADLFTKNPSLAAQAMPQEVSNLGISLSNIAPVAKPAARQDGVESIQDKFSRIFNEFVAQGQPPGAASEAAQKMIEADRKLMLGDVNAIEQSRQKLEALDNLISTAEVGVKGAGETGGAFGGARDVASSVFASLPDFIPGAAEEAKQRAAQKNLETIAPDVIAAARQVGSGAMSDREMAAYLAAGPSAKNTPLENKEILAKMKNIRDLARDYNDFREWYREQKGTLSGAAQVWDQYKKANPVVVEGEWNPQRQSWSEFIAQATLPTSDSVQLSPTINSASMGLPAIGSQFQGSKVVSIKKIK